MRRLPNRLFFAVLCAAFALILSGAPDAVGGEPEWTTYSRPKTSFTMIAHRGAGDLAPENCMTSLELSWGMGATPEVDVQQTSDGHIVMFHDGNFKRILPNASEELKNKRIKDLTFEEVRQLDIGSFRGEQFKGEKVVSIEEIVEALKKDNRRHVVIDVKEVDLEKLAKAIYDVRFQTTLTTWDEDLLAKWADICPNADGTLWMGLGQMTDEQLEARFKTLREKNFRGINRFHLHVTRDANGELSPTPAFIRSHGDELRRRGIEFQAMPWPTPTCPGAKTDKALFRRLLELGAMGFGADRPDVAYEVLDEYFAAAPDDWNVADHIAPDEIVVMGHRGMGNEAPEGTMETFKLAWANGVCPEADVRTTKDGVIVSLHDDNFARLLPGAPDEIKKKGVKDMTFDEVKDIDVGVYKGEQFKGQRIASLADIVAALKEDRSRYIFCDLKNIDMEQFARETVEVHPQICLTGCEYEPLKRWKKLAPRSNTLIWMPVTWSGTVENLEERFNVLRDANFEGLDFVQVHVLPEGPGKVGPDVETLRRISNACRKQGVNFETYLLKNGDKDFAYETLLDAGVMSIATDFPSKAREVIAKYCESKK